MTRIPYAESDRPPLIGLVRIARAWNPTLPLRASWERILTDAPTVQVNNMTRASGLDQLQARAWLGAWLWNRVVPQPIYPRAEDFPDMTEDENGQTAYDRAVQHVQNHDEVWDIDDRNAYLYWTSEQGLWPILLHGVEYQWTDDDLSLACRARLNLAEMEQAGKGIAADQRDGLKTLAALR